MTQLKAKKYAAIILALISVTVQANAYADCNYSCTVAGPSLPCGTWAEPFRTCPTSYDDPGCLAGRATCVAAAAAEAAAAAVAAAAAAVAAASNCISNGLLALGATDACAGAVVGDVASDGGITVATIGLCGLTAAQIQKAQNDCGH